MISSIVNAWLSKSETLLESVMPGGTSAINTMSAGMGFSSPPLQTNLIKFLSNAMKLKVNYDKIKISNNLSTFTNLKNFETKNKFFENNSSENFFRIGKSGNWKKELNKAQIKKIEESFKVEMKILGYL